MGPSSWAVGGPPTAKLRQTKATLRTWMAKVRTIRHQADEVIMNGPIRRLSLFKSSIVG